MLTAIETVHAKNGPWLSKGGYEYNVVLIAAVLTLVELDRERSGSRSALAVLLAGALGAVGAHVAAAAAPVPPAAATKDADVAEQEVQSG